MKDDFEICFHFRKSYHVSDGLSMCLSFIWKVSMPLADKTIAHDSRSELQKSKGNICRREREHLDNLLELRDELCLPPLAPSLQSCLGGGGTFGLMILESPLCSASQAHHSSPLMHLEGHLFTQENLLSTSCVPGT